MRAKDVVVLEEGDPGLADEVMRLAIMTYGTLLEHSERTVAHGLHGTLKLQVDATPLRRP